MMGLPVEVFRPASTGDCTNGGFSSKCKEFTLVGTEIDGTFEELPKMSQVFEASEDKPAVVLVVIEYRWGKVPHYELFEKSGHRMFGGNFAYTSDSRLVEALVLAGCEGYGAVKIFDREVSYDD